MMKQRSIHFSMLVLFSFFAVFSLSGSILGKTLFVKSEYRTVQEAIDDADYGDVVMVDPGTYDEALHLKEGVTLLGNGSNLTRLDAQADAIGIVAEAGSRISGFAIDEGFVGIEVVGDGVEISDNYIYTRYIGIRSLGVSPMISGNEIHSVYICIMTRDGGAPTISHNVLTGRYWGILANSTSPYIHNNKIADFEQGIYTVNSNATIVNNSIINSLFDGVVITQGSGAFLINNAIIGHFERGVSIFDSSPMLLNNIITENATGLYCHNATPVLSHNCIASNRDADYEGAEPGPDDIAQKPLLRGVGIVSDISGSDFDKLICNEANWEPDSLVGLDLIPNTEKMYIIYGGQDRVYDILSNTRTSITVEVNIPPGEDDASHKTLRWRGRRDQYKPGESVDYTKSGDTFFVDDLVLQDTASGWDANSPCINAGNPDAMYNDADGSRNNVGIFGGPSAGVPGPIKAPIVKLSSLEQIYKYDETVDIRADLSNERSDAVEADLYIAILVDGVPGFFSYPNWTPGLNPVPYSLSAGFSDDDMPVLEMAAAAMPLASYHVMAAFTKRGSMEFISPINELWFKVSE
ncbi:right-handed parallel beta-helix repeat-containing protein [bacterium]|nr:right-handed parallel beta-helix repeat-containing protein [bacterium]